jgi:7-carboxy-7-deazaguanine synthase
MDNFPIMEYFYTIQGEGKHAGTAAYFIRVGGCDVGCVWCDVKDSWDSEAHPKKYIDDLVKEVLKTPAQIVVITGGEPAMYDLSKLINKFHELNLKVHVETSGAYPIIGDYDWVTFSPKKFKPPVTESTALADELKVVVFNKSDFKWAELYEKEVPDNCELFLQPEWGKEAEINPLIIDYVKEHPQWRISLQTHKYLAIP